jgi:hypothetical protein
MTRAGSRPPTAPSPRQSTRRTTRGRRTTAPPHDYLAPQVCPFTLHPPVFFSDNVGVKHLHSDHSTVVQFTHLIKNNNKKKTNTPLHTQAAPGGLHTSTSSSLHRYLTFIVPPSVPTSAPSSVTEISTVSKPRPSAEILHPSFLQSQNPVSTLTTSSEAHRFIGTSTKKVVNIALSPPADRGILLTVSIRSLELPPSLTDDQDSPLGLPKSSLRTCPSLMRWLGAQDLQPNHKASPPEVPTGPPPVPDGNSFVTPALARGNQPSPDHTATRGTTSGKSPALRPVNNSFVTPASTQGSALVVQSVTSGLPTVQLSARRPFQPARSPHRHTTTKWAPSPTLTAITKPSVTTVTGGNISNDRLTVAAERILQSRPQPEVSTGPPRHPGDSIITATTAIPNPQMAATESDNLGSHQGRTSLASSPTVQTGL